MRRFTLAGPILALHFITVGMASTPSAQAVVVFGEEPADIKGTQAAEPLRLDGNNPNAIIFGPLPPDDASQRAGGRDSLEQGYNQGVLQYRQKGNGGPNYPQAVQAWRKAADKGYTPAQVALAYLYLKGKGVMPDIAEAERLARRAANAGNPRGWFVLSLIREEKGASTEALGFLKQAAAQNDTLALLTLGIRSERGQGLPQDLNKARDYYKRAAKSGSLQARQHLLRLAISDKETLSPRDRFEQVQALASTGDAAAMYQLGLMFHVGDGTGISYRDALEWYRKSAEQNYYKARNMLAMIFSRTSPAGGLDPNWMREIAMLNRPRNGGVNAVPPETEQLDPITD